MISDKPHSSSAPVVTKQQKQLNSAGKTKLVQSSSAKKTQQPLKKRTLVSKPQTVNGASSSLKPAVSTHTNGGDKSSSNSNGNRTIKQDRKVSDSLSTLSNTTETVVKDSTRVPALLQSKPTPPPPPILSPQRPLPNVDSFWSVTIREHDLSYRWKEEMEEEDRLSAYKEARRLRYIKALQAQKEELGISENRRKYLYAPVS